MNKYHLHVYKLVNITTESPMGFFASVKMKEFWDAPFKDDESLLAAVIDYSGWGFYCQVVKN